MAAACGRTLARHRRVTRRARRAPAGALGTTVAVLPDTAPYAYALPGTPGRVVVTSGLLDGLAPAERRALFYRAGWRPCWPWGAAVGTLVSAMSSANSAVTLFQTVSKSPASAEAIRRCDSASVCRPCRWSVRPSISRA